MKAPALLGVDVGFSKSKKNTGLAWFEGSTIETALTGTSWPERNHSLPRNVRFAVVALDAPSFRNTISRRRVVTNEHSTGAAFQSAAAPASIIMAVAFP
jgi:hypothetical protein